jgi:hypothetical protein
VPANLYYHEVVKRKLDRIVRNNANNHEQVLLANASNDSTDCDLHLVKSKPNQVIEEDVVLNGLHWFNICEDANEFLSENDYYCPFDNKVATDGQHRANSVLLG